MLGGYIQKLVKKRAETVVLRIKPFIGESTSIVDIGSGTGDVSILLKTLNKNITPVDVSSFHGFRSIQPVIYDGVTLPFADNSFDTALLLMVMHHTPNPDKLFSEASRVAKEIVVIETSYTNTFHKFYTVLTDVLGNLQIEGFWNSYKTDRQWRELFNKHDFRVIESNKYWDRNMGLPFLHISYYLKRKA